MQYYKMNNMNSIASTEPQSQLILILDAHSSMKSKIAKKLCEIELRTKYNIEYITSNQPFITCENPFKSCCARITDRFVIKYNDAMYHVGNHCISNLILANRISNISSTDFKHIVKKLAVKNICMMCHKSRTKTVPHKSCLSGKNEKTVVDYKQIFNFIKCKDYILLLRIKELLRDVSMLKGVSQIVEMQNKCKSNLYKRRDFMELNKIIDNYPILCNPENYTKLKLYKNNCIIRSIQTQRRFPSIKQLAVVDKILEHHDRMIIIDCDNNNETYKQYGFIY